MSEYPHIRVGREFVVALLFGSITGAFSCVSGEGQGTSADADGATDEDAGATFDAGRIGGGRDVGMAVDARTTADAEMRRCGNDPECGTGMLCCEAPLPCAGQCIPDCRARADACPMGMVCESSSGYCAPGGDGGIMNLPDAGRDGGVPPDAGSTADGGTRDGSALDLAGSISREQVLTVDALARGTTLPNIIKIRRPVIDESAQRAYFSGTLSPELGVIDTVTDEIVDAIDTGIHGYISKTLGLNDETGIVYMSTLEDQRLYRIDPIAKTVSPPVSVAGGSAFSVDSTNDRIYATTRSEIVIFDGDLNRTGSIAGQFMDVEVVPSTGRLYASVLPSRVQVFETTNHTEVASYDLPRGLLARFITVANGKIYVTCAPKSVVIIDPATSGTTTVAFDNETGSSQVFGGSLYVMTGYPFRAGYLPNADGAYGVVEVVDAETGAKETSFYAGQQGEGFAIHASSEKMYVANTGDSYVDVVDLATHARTKRIDTATSIEDIVVRPSDGALIMRNRLGGGNSLLLVNNGIVSDAPSPGNWPTKTLFDPRTNKVHTLSHYESKVSSFDIETLGSISSISLGVARLRSDGLSTMALDSSGQKLYVAMPELGQVVAVDLTTQRAATAVTVSGFDTARADGPGLLQLAVNERLGRVYLFSPKQLELFVYDRSLALLRTTHLPEQAGAAAGGVLDAVTFDEGNDRLYVLSMILDAEGEQVTGNLPDGDRVVAVYPEGDRIFTAKAVISSSPGAADGHDRLVEIRASSLEVLRTFDLSPYDVVKTTFAFDFERGLAFAGYFETGTVDVLRMGVAR